ncbi:MAG: SCO1664 family protein [Ilumatobacter sp.]|nr:SCO1664 family protein [Ilumatobacter sp.]
MHGDAGDELDGCDDETDDDGADGENDETGVELRIDDVDDPIEHLLRGEVDVEGRMPYSSNATFLVHVVHDGRSHPAIYKPLRGERPLWDFGPGLHRREVATYLMSEMLGLHVVPPTVLRDGPLGEGSVQWFVTGDYTEHYFTIYEAYPELHDRLREMALLDVICNNTDRKSGHCILVPSTSSDDGAALPPEVWGIDHGLCFSADYKLRTVIWEFADEPIPDDLLERVNRLVERVPLPIAALLSDDEVEAIQQRATWCVTHRAFPADPSGRRYPWPLV